MNEYKRILLNWKWIVILFLLSALNLLLYAEYVKATLNCTPQEASAAVHLRQDNIINLSAEEAEEQLNRGKEELNARQAASFLISVGMDTKENIRKYAERYENFEMIIDEVRSDMAENLNAGLFACDFWLETIPYFHDYSTRTDVIRENAEKLINSSAFSEPSSYAYRNIKKTVHDYERCEGIEVSLHSDLHLRFLKDYRPSEVFVLLSILTAVCVIKESDERNISILTDSCVNGRKPLHISQLISLFVISIISVLLMRVILLFFSSFLFHEPVEMDLYVQNYACFEHFTLPLKTGQYILLSSEYEIIAFFFAGCLLLGILSLFQSQLSGTAVIAILIFAEYLLFGKYGIHDKFYILSSVNIFSLVSFWTFIRRYLNFNLYTIPVSALSVSLAVIVICTVFFVGIRIFKRPHTERRRRRLKAVSAFRRYREDHRHVLPLWLSEFHKVMIHEKGIIIPVLLICMLGMIRPYSVPRDLYYCELAVKFHGPVSETVLDEIKREKAELEESIQTSANPDLQEQYYLNAYIKLESRYEELLSFEADDPVILTDETDMEYLYGENGKQYRMLSLLITMIVIGLLAPCFTVSEEGLYALHASTVSGRKKLFRNKQFVIALITLIIFMIHTSYDLILLQKIPDNLTVSCYSYEAIHIDKPLYEFFVIILLYRLIGYLILSQILLITNTYAKRYILCASINAVIALVLIGVFSFISRADIFPRTISIVGRFAAYPMSFLLALTVVLLALILYGYELKRNEKL